MSSSSLILGIDTSCDETSIAVLKEGKELLSNVVSSQIDVHKLYGGVVPELASRSHLENIGVVLKTALNDAQIALSEIGGIAVTTSPGLIGCLLVGLSYAKGMAYSLRIPLTAVHHLKAHLFSPFLEYEEIYPFLGLVVSGGHTALYHVKGFSEITSLGQTVDDAAGEAFDKVAKLLGLGFPGGPLIDKLSHRGNPKAFSFTRARVKKGPYYFSFSGLKTAVSLLVKKMGEKLSSQTVDDIAASFQEEVVESLVEKVKLACTAFPSKAILLSGGVAANSALRGRLQTLADERRLSFFVPSPLICTDNGAMVAYVGAKQLAEKKVAGLDCNAYASNPMW